MSVAVVPNTPLMRMCYNVRSVGVLIKQALDRYLRLVRLNIRKTDRKLGLAIGSSTTPLTKLQPHVQMFNAYLKASLGRSFHLLCIVVKRIDKWVALAMGSPTTPLTRLNPYIKIVTGRVRSTVIYLKPILKRNLRISRVMVIKVDKKLHKASQTFAAILQHYDGKPEMQGMLLGVFAMASAFFLATADLSTRNAIAERAAEDLRYSLSQVVPAAKHNNNLADDIAELQDTEEGQVSFYRARMNDDVAAIALEMVSQGYSGSIKVLLGIDTGGNLLGVRVLAHTETPGLGDKIEQKKSDWILGFNGLSLGNPIASKWKVKKDGGHFDQFSGATITPRAVVVAVRRGLELFQRNRDQFLDITKKSCPESS